MDQTQTYGIGGAPETVSPTNPANGLQPDANLEQEIRDEVVVNLIYKGMLTVDDARRLREKHPDSNELWREAAYKSFSNPSAFFSEAAIRAGYESRYVGEDNPTDEIIESILGLFNKAQIKQMLENGILPVEIESQGSDSDFTLSLVSFDPTHAAVQGIVNHLAMPSLLAYADWQVIRDRITRLGYSLGLSPTSPDDPDFVSELLAPGRQALADIPEEPAPMQPDRDPISKLDLALEEALNRDKEIALGGLDLIGESINEEQDSILNMADTFSDDDFEMLFKDGGLELSLDDLTVDEPIAPVEPEVPELPELPIDEVEEEVQDTTEIGQDVSEVDVDVAPVHADRGERAELRTRDRVILMLHHKHAIKTEQIEQAIEQRKELDTKDALWRVLAEIPGVNKEMIYEEAAAVYAFGSADLDKEEPDTDFAKAVMESISEENKIKLMAMNVIPQRYDVDPASGTSKLLFVTHDPTLPELHRLLQSLQLGRFELRYAPEKQVGRHLLEIFPQKNEYLERLGDDPLATDLGTSYEEEAGLIDEEALEAEISRSTLINLFEATLLEATRQGASDIHIFPNAQRKLEIMFRLDGRLKRWHTEERVHPEAFLAVAKDKSGNIDRFERDMAQDGFIQRNIDGALIRFRVSVLPIATANADIRAESIVIRVLDDRKVLTDLRKLGMLEGALERFDLAIRQPHGMVILTGPTGSGKSTTLVAALHQVVTPEVNVLTVEDPVEYIIKGVRQIKLSHKLNLEQALRSILRHDPDIVMVGEMRDKSTAELAIKLANTGHLTFSTLHTNDAPSAVSRLYKMGVEPFLIAYAINLVVAQRLIRNLCPSCKEVDENKDKVLMKQLGFTKEEIEEVELYKRGNAKKCKTCSGTGYKGRRAMCETLYFSQEIQHLIVEAGEAIDEDAIREQGKSEGMLTLQDSAREIVKMGETSIEEMIRVTSTE